MLKLIVISINILCCVQIINCDQTEINDEVINNETNQNDSFVFEAVQLFDKLKQLEVTTLENIKRLNFLSNDQMIAKGHIYDKYELEFNKEIESFQNIVKPKLYKGFDLENCSSETAKEFDVIYTDEKSYPSILLTTLQLEQDKIVSNYSHTIEDLFKDGIEEFKMSFLNTDSMNQTELTSFSHSFEKFLVDINQNVGDEYHTAGRKIMNTTSSYQTDLDEKLIQIKDRMKILIDNFANCTKDFEFDL